MRSFPRLERPLFEVSPQFALYLTRLLTRVSTTQVEELSACNAIERVLRSVGLFERQLWKSLCTLPSQQISELKLIRFGRIDYLRNLERDVTGEGLDEARSALRQGQGLILGCTHIGLFYHALIQARKLTTSLLIVTGNQRYSEDVVNRLRLLSNVNIRMVPAATQSALTITRHLRRGGVVATMLDHYVDTTLAIEVPFFGKPAKTAAGIFQIAVANGSPILPIAVTNVQEGRSVETAQLVVPNSSAAELATTVNSNIEAMVRRHPQLWSNWLTLEQRWRQSHSLTSH